MSDDHANDLDMPAAEFLDLGGKMLELAAQWLEAEATEPVLRHRSGVGLAAWFDQPPPESGMPVDELLRELRDKVLAYSRHNGHPRQFAHVCASPDPAGALADLLVSTIN